jgi:hypothetical protein
VQGWKSEKGFQPLPLVGEKLFQAAYLQEGTKK